MDERAVKRLLVTLAVSIAIIMVLKNMMLKVGAVKADRANKAVAERRQATPPPPAEPPVPPSFVPVPEPAASTASGTPGMDAATASGVSP